MSACRHCGAEPPPNSVYCPQCAGPPGDSDASATRTALHQPATLSSSRSSTAEGRFVAGTVLNGRYRIVHLGRRGGMGEVLVRLAVRRDWIAAVVVVIVMTLAITMAALIRYGVVVAAISEFVAWSMVTLPVTADFSAWYATGPVYCALAVVALAAYGFHCARDRRLASHAG